MTSFYKKHKILSTVILIALVDILLLVISYFALSVFTNHGNKETVPSLTGMDVEKATEMLDRRNLKIEIADSSYVEGARPGSILEQNPEAGSFVKDGRTIYVTIRTYSTKLVKVPMLTDMSSRQSQSILTALGIKDVRIQSVPSEFRDLVTDVRCNGASLTEGSKIPVNATVTLFVGDGSLSGARELSKLGLPVMGLPGTIDNDLAYTDYTIGFDTAINTAMQAIDKVRDTSSSHERCSIIEVMGRNAGYIALWCGIANGAEDILLPEKYDYDEQKIVDNIINNRKHGKKHHIIINAEGIGHSTSMARRIEAATGIETRATILGYMQRGGSPTCKDRYYASIMGAYAADIVAAGKRDRIVACRDGKFVDVDIEEALAMTKSIPEYQYEISQALSR